jgi:hypothetical protein
MHGFKRHLIVGALACGVAALTGSALAAPPNPPPGQEKKAEQPPAPAAPTPSDNGKPTPPGQEKQGAEPAKPAKPAPAKAGKAAPAQPAPAKADKKSSEKSNGINAGTAGVKPSNNTSKNTSCKTGGAMPSPTCTRDPQGNNPPDSSKRYGNGKTAAQIATSRGAPAGTEIRGPGNSQPHKVCGKNGHFVDVHAVKSYTGLNCAETPSAVAAQPTPTVTVSCPETTTLLTTGVAHETGSGKIVVIHPSLKSAHLRKHGDKLVTVEVTLASGATCSATVPAATSTVATQTTTQQIAAAVQQATGGTVVSTAVAPQAAPASGVLGAEHTASGTGGTGSTGGVAGAFAEIGGVAAGSLPFTGFPLWAAVVIGLAAVALGWMLWRRSRPATTDIV